MPALQWSYILSKLLLSRTKRLVGVSMCVCDAQSTNTVPGILLHKPVLGRYHWVACIQKRFYKLISTSNRYFLQFFN